MLLVVIHPDFSSTTGIPSGSEVDYHITLIRSMKVATSIVLIFDNPVLTLNMGGFTDSTKTVI
jgi:hypothetical protein